MDKFHFRYSQKAINQLSFLFEYWLILHPESSSRWISDQINLAFEAPCIHPKMKQIVETKLESDYVYRRVNVWRFAFLYRIDEAERELVIDRIYHERSVT